MQRVLRASSRVRGPPELGPEMRLRGGHPGPRRRGSAALMLLLIAASGRLYSHRLSQRVLRIGSQSVPFRGSAIVPTISYFLSRALKR